MAKKKEKEHSKWEWFIEVCIITFILSICFSYISTNGVSHLNLVASIFILIAVIAIGIIFDIIGVAVTVANEHEFHAKATKKVYGAKTSLKLIFTLYYTNHVATRKMQKLDELKSITLTLQCIKKLTLI